MYFWQLFSPYSSLGVAPFIFEWVLATIIALIVVHIFNPNLNVLFELFLEEVQMMDRVDCGSVLVLYQNPDSLRTPPQIDFKGCYQNGWELLANFR